MIALRPRVLLSLTLSALCLGKAAHAQADSRAAAAKACGEGPTQSIYLANAPTTNDGNEIVTAVRNIIAPDARIYFVPTQNAIIIHCSADVIALAQKVVADLDRPRKTYRITYTFTEVDGGKRIGTQHFSLMAAAGQRTTLKQGSKVPVATGSYSSGNAATQTQFTYLDIGMNFDATPTEVAGGTMLKTKVEQSDIFTEKSMMNVMEPVVRQTVIETTSMLVLGKPLILGSIDVPGSTRHLDVEVMIEVAK